jgi:hypothetical protein
MLLVTLHGGKPGKNPKLNNVHAYDKNGKKLSACVLKDSPGFVLDELRGIYLEGKYLYVVNANRNENKVLCYAGEGLSYKYVSTFISRKECPAVFHPFDLAFDNSGNCYVSSQDTNVVTRLKMTSGGKIGKPAKLAAALPPKGEFLAGTHVASSKSLKPATTPVKPPLGLEYFSEDGEKMHSVRGVAWWKGALYVADQPARRIKVYDRKGRFVGQSNGIESPTHLVVHNGMLYVSGGDEVLRGKLPKTPGDFELAPVKGVKIKNSSGMAFTGKGRFYVASRSQRRIFKFDSDFKPMPFDCELPDDPEFLLHV